MCELLGLSANTPTDISFSFSGLKQRGGNTGETRTAGASVYTKAVAVEVSMNPDRVLIQRWQNFFETLR